jgi:predicted RNA-binding Zn-ribbon protein involved in translation (DUF1610 family)
LRKNIEYGVEMTTKQFLMEIKNNDPFKRIIKIWTEKEMQQEFIHFDTKGGISMETITLLYRNQYAGYSAYHNLRGKGDTYTFVHLPMVCSYCKETKDEVMSSTAKDIFICGKCKEEMKKMEVRCKNCEGIMKAIEIPETYNVIYCPYCGSENIEAIE